MARLRCQYFVAMFLLFGVVEKVACQPTEEKEPFCPAECHGNKCLGALSSGCPQPFECKNVDSESVGQNCVLAQNRYPAVLVCDAWTRCQT